MWNASRWIPISMIAVTLAGCGPEGRLPSPRDTSSICKALIGPIKYNSLDKDSKRFAAQVLALDLKQRNQVGVALRCPRYRR